MTDTTQQPQASAILLPAAQSSKSGGQEIRVKELIHVLIKRRAWIIVCVILGIVFGMSMSVLSYVKAQTIKQYSVKTSIALTSQSESGLFSKSSRDPDSTDFYLAEDMVDAAEFILMSDTMLNKIIENVNLLGVSARDIYNSLSMEQYKSTQIIIINLYWGNASEGVRILETMNRLAPDLLIKTLKLGSVTVINDPTARFVIGGNLNLSRNLVLGVTMGMMLGAALAVFDLLLRPRLLTLTDVEKRLRIPLLGTIAENYSDTPLHTELLSKDDGTQTRSDLADSCLAAAYALKRHLAGQEHPVVFVTSAEHGEGRTTVTACLAAALAKIGVRVLAADFDFRNPMLAGLFFPQIDPAQTINALYQGKAVPEDAVLPVNGLLDLLPAQLERDPMPLNAAALDLIRELRGDYDIVLLDTPPVGQIADTMALNELTEQALFVIQYDGATQAALKEALTRLDSVEIKVIGSVVNRANRKRIDPLARKKDGKKRRPFAKLSEKRKKKSRAKGSAPDQPAAGH